MVTEIRPLREVKRTAILDAVVQLQDVSLAADALGLGKRTLYRKLKEYGGSWTIGPRGFRRREQRAHIKGNCELVYEPEKLVLLIKQHLRTSPNLSLGKLTGLLSIDRHTIERAARNATGKSFRQLRNAVMLEEVKKLQRKKPRLSKKEIAGKLGYSSQSSLSRFLKANSDGPSVKAPWSARAPK